MTLFLGLSAAQMSAGDLGVSSHQYYQERARQMADYGLERCVVQDVPSGSLLNLQSVSGAHPDDSVRVTVFGPGQVGSPVTVPTGCEYWVAEGKAAQGFRTLASARVGAMVRFGRPVGSAGAQIRYMAVEAENDDPVTFKVIDRVTNQEVEDEVVCSTEATELPTSGPPMPFLVTPVTLRKVQDFKGMVRIPQAANNAIVSYDIAPEKLVPITQDGGPLNVPEYSPPGGLAYFSTVTVSDTTDLPPGRYGMLKLMPSAVAQLNGVYHIEKLEVLGGDSSPRLLVKALNSAKVFVNSIQQDQRPLEIQNRQHIAGDFRLTFREEANPLPPVLLKMIEGGEAAVVAPGRALGLISDDNRRVQGAFSSEVLRVNFPTGSGPVPQFIYDISGTTARRPRGPSVVDGGPGGPVGGGTPIPPDGNPGDTGYVDPGAPPNPGDTGKPKLPGSALRPSGTEPMILSRQNL
ncbi:hypothetical protein IV102_11770 [bacterium]|nr:hypothetical protein [bacterium]